jgi:hypothetical protein
MVCGMTPDQATALLVALTGLIGAVVALWRETHLTRQAMDGRLDELVSTKATAAAKEGELRGRDYVRGQLAPSEGATSTSVPLASDDYKA